MSISRAGFDPVYAIIPHMIQCFLLSLLFHDSRMLLEFAASQNHDFV